MKRLEDLEHSLRRALVKGLYIQSLAALEMGAVNYPLFTDEEIETQRG